MLAATLGTLSLLAATPPAATATASAPAASRPATSRSMAAIIAPPRRDVPGRRFALSTGSLYVPDFYDAGEAASTDVVVWFHGAAWCAEQVFYDARKNAVLVTISGVDYGAVFQNPDRLTQLLEAVSTTLAREGVTSKPIGRICLGSFSAGYTGVRAILRQERFRGLISDVVLADSLYAPRVEGEPDKLDPEAMAPFLDYARRAASGRCTFWFSQLCPPEERYRTNTTTLAANYLIDRVGAKRQPASSRNSRGATLLYRADLGGFHVLGYAGMTSQDHFDHFYAAGDLIRETSLPSAVSVTDRQ